MVFSCQRIFILWSLTVCAASFKVFACTTWFTKVWTCTCSTLADQTSSCNSCSSKWLMFSYNTIYTRIIEREKEYFLPVDILMKEYDWICEFGGKSLWCECQFQIMFVHKYCIPVSYYYTLDYYTLELLVDLRRQT